MRAGALAAAALAATAGCRAPAPPPDLVLLARTVVRLDSSPPARAVAVGGGRILAVGGPELAQAAAAAGARVVDLGDAVIAPALVDHHVHLYNVGLTLLNDAENQRLFVDLSDATSIAEVARRVRARERGLLSGRWIVGAGWSQAAWGTEALPDHAPLSRAAPGHPVFLARVDGHAGWVNRRALETGGLWGPAPGPAGGLVLRGPSGDPLGILLERANEPVMRRIPGPDDADGVRAFRLAAEALAARGVIEVFDAGALAFPGVVSLDADLGRMLAQLRRADSAAPLPLAVNLMIPAPSLLADSVLAAPAVDPLSPRIRITHVKLFVDGALGSRGAALTHVYADDTTTAGVPRMTVAEIVALALRALDRGLDVATHAIGDEAVRRTLDAYEQVRRERPRLEPARLRIEHFSYAREEDLARAAGLGVVLSVQSNFNALPGDDPTFAARRVGPANEARVYAWDRLLRLGARLAEGSDYFARPGPALAGVTAALIRRGAVGEGRPDPEGRRLAWRLNATLHPAGGGLPPDPDLRAGAAAHLVILSDDPLTVPRERLDSVAVLATFRSGVPTYATPALADALTRRP